MKRKILLLCLCILPGFSGMVAQRMLTLQECYEKAYSHTPVSDEKLSFDALWQLKDRNLSAGWLPSLVASGSFIYQSSVVDMTEVMEGLPFPITGYFQSMPHEQYKVTLEVNQMVYDGGATRSARAMAMADLHLNDKQTDIDLYKLKEQINHYYFGVLLIDRQQELLQGYLELTDKRIASLNAALESGVMLKTDLDVLQGEKIRLQQQIIGNEIRKASLEKLLSSITGIDLDTSIRLLMPVFKGPLPVELKRPELQMFDLKKEYLEASLKAIRSKRNPRAFVFGTFGMGNPPGNNFFKDEFAPYYFLGAGLSWKIYDWKGVQNEIRMVSCQQSILENRKEELSDQMKRQLDAGLAEIHILESMLATDEELIVLRKRITAAAESKYQNGTITMTELMHEINTEIQAEKDLQIHQIQLEMARTQYLNICGKDF